MVAEPEVLALTASPVEMTSTFDTVVIAVFWTVAVTMTIGVGMVPAETAVVTRPLASLVVVCGWTERPPTVVFSVNATGAPRTGCPTWSKTWKVRVENSCLPTPPVPLSAMLIG